MSTPEEARALIRRSSTRRKKKVVYTEEVQDAEGEKPEADEAFDGPLTDIDDEPAEKSPKKRRRRTKTQEPVVYDIPPVETKSTDFKGMCAVAYSPMLADGEIGRLGYACLNTVLRALKPDPVFCSRTCRIDTIKKFGLEHCKELGRKNAEDLSRLIQVRCACTACMRAYGSPIVHQWNEENNIKFLRVSSEMFPFASHSIYGYTLEYAEKELKV